MNYVPVSTSASEIPKNLKPENSGFYCVDRIGAELIENCFEVKEEYEKQPPVSTDHSSVVVSIVLGALFGYAVARSAR